MPNHRKPHYHLLALFFILLCIGGLVSAFTLPGSTNNDPFSNTTPSKPNDFLPVEEAFPYEIHEYPDQKGLTITWNIPSGYYLYKDRIHLVTQANIQITKTFPQGVIVDDPEYGAVEVFNSPFSVKIDFAQPLDQTTTFELQYQGCAEAGLCYPPQKKSFTMTVENSVNNQPTVHEPSNKAPIANGDQDEPQNEFHSILKGSSFSKVIFLFFIAGIGLTFTPCVLPMVPILSSIIVGQKEKQSRSNALFLSLVYVLGMSLTYAAIGTLMGYFGAKLNIQVYMQSPGVLIFSAAIFVILSLSMFGFYDLTLPRWLHDRLHNMHQKQKGGNYLGVALMGILSSLIVSPCVSAPLSGALFYISSTGDPFGGGMALLALGFGMGIPLLIIGTTEGQLLPKAGAWMHGIKSAFGVLLLAVAIYLLDRILPDAVVLILWATLCIGSAVFLGALDFAPKQGMAQFWKAIGFVFLIYGVMLLIGAASGQTNPLKPLENMFAGQSASSVQTNKPQFAPINNLNELTRALQKSNGKPTLVDIYADWCISCKIIDRTIFQNQAVANQLQGFNLLQLDITKGLAQHTEFLSHFTIFGPPSILFFDPNGQEMKAFQLQGEFEREQFQMHLANILEKFK